MRTSWTHYRNVLNAEEAAETGEYVKYCYAIGELNGMGVGCCLFTEEHFPNHDTTEDGRILHLDPDEGPFESGDYA